MPLFAGLETSVGGGVEELVPVIMDVTLVAQVFIASDDSSWLTVQVACILFWLTVDELVHFLFGVLVQGFFVISALHFLFELHFLEFLFSVLEVVVAGHVQPRVVQHFPGGSSLVMVPGKHRKQEVGKGLGLVFPDEVFVGKYFLDGPEAEALDPS